MDIRGQTKPNLSADPKSEFKEAYNDTNNDNNILVVALLSVSHRLLYTHTPLG